MKTDVVSEVLKAFPPTVVWALTLDDVVRVVTIVYVVVQAAYLLRKWWREEKRKDLP